MYHAEQVEPVARRVALKIIKLGMETKEVVARFEAERQAVALMDHPSIARVFDAGRDRDGPALLRHGAGAGPAHHRLLRPRAAHHRGAPAPLHPGVPGRPARAPEGRDPPRPQALQHPGHHPGRAARAEDHRFRHRQGPAPPPHRPDPGDPHGRHHGHPGLHEPGAARRRVARRRHPGRHLQPRGHPLPAAERPPAVRGGRAPEGGGGGGSPARSRPAAAQRPGHHRRAARSAGREPAHRCRPPEPGPARRPRLDRAQGHGPRPLRPATRPRTAWHSTWSGTSATSRWRPGLLRPPTARASS